MQWISCGCLRRLTQLSLVLALHSVRYRPQGEHKLRASTMPIRSTSPGEIQDLLQKICVWERLLFFSFLLQWKKKEKKYFYVIETFLELFLGCFILYVLWRRTKINRQTKAKTMPFRVGLVKHRVQWSTKSTGLEKWFTNIDYPLMLTVSPVYFLHAFLRNIRKNIWKISWQQKRIRTDKALSQQTNSVQAIVYLHDWAQRQNTAL